MNVLQFDPPIFADRAALDSILVDTPDRMQLSFPLDGSPLLVGLDADDLTATAATFS